MMGILVFDFGGSAVKYGMDKRLKTPANFRLLRHGKK